MTYKGDLYKSCRNWNQLKSSALCNPPRSNRVKFEWEVVSFQNVPKCTHVHGRIFMNIFDSTILIDHGPLFFRNHHHHNHHLDVKNTSHRSIWWGGLQFLVGDRETPPQDTFEHTWWWGWWPFWLWWLWWLGCSGRDNEDGGHFEYDD